MASPTTTTALETPSPPPQLGDQLDSKQVIKVLDMVLAVPFPGIFYSLTGILAFAILLFYFNFMYTFVYKRNRRPVALTRAEMAAADAEERKKRRAGADGSQKQGPCLPSRLDAMIRPLSPAVLKDRLAATRRKQRTWLREVRDLEEGRDEKKSENGVLVYGRAL